ncbi:MAG: hypothetical protein K2Q33_08605 [Gammaproteobacteria bacterium]|nr:hypothetical protein [Gammaproteobacteria bacterium]
MQSLTLMGIIILLLLFYGFSGYRPFKALVFHRKLIAFLLTISAAIGIDYLLRNLLPNLFFYRSMQEGWSNAISVFIFTLSECIGIWQLIRNHDQYKLWVIPALFDLFLKGFIAFVVFENTTWLIWDSFRAVFLLIFIYYDRQKRVTTHPSVRIVKPRLGCKMRAQ